MYIFPSDEFIQKSLVLPASPPASRRTIPLFHTETRDKRGIWSIWCWIFRITYRKGRLIDMKAFSYFFALAASVAAIKIDLLPMEKRVLDIEYVNEV